MRINRLLVFPMVLFSLASCRNSVTVEQKASETHELFTVTERDYRLNTEYPAAICGYQDIRIIPRVEGYLQGLFVKEGDCVRANQLLFKIDDASYRAAVESASANVEMMTAALNRAQLEYQGKQSLHEKEIVSDFELSLAESDLDVAKANLSASKASLAAARNELGYTEIRSSSDGVIGKIPYRKGDFVGPTMQDGLTIVADNHMMRVYFSMTEKQVMQYLSQYGNLTETVRKMPELQLRLSDGSLYEKKGRVESISGIVDEETGAVAVCALFDNADGMLLSGGTGKVVLPTELHNAIVIPQEATYDIQDKVYVVKVVDGKAMASMIQVEPSTDGKSYVVTDGLKVGEVIVAKGAGFVKEGTEIAPTN